MSKHARDRRPYIKPVTRVELSETNIKLRWIAIAVLLSVAVVAIGYGFSQALSAEPGWQTVTVTSDEVNCAQDFTLMYDIGAGDVNPTGQYKKLETLYTQLTESAYRLFSPEAEGTDNLFYLHTHVNETVTVAPELYNALEQIAASGNRHPFMGPVRELYDPVFLSSDDAEAANYDPMKNRELMELAQRTAAYCADPQMIALELLGSGQVRLAVSQDYLTFAEEYGIETFLDFGWMKNAFIVDYIAEALVAQGHNHGYLASYDGFTRNLDIRGGEYSLNIFHREDNNVYMPAVLEYSGPMSLVTLRDYPTSEQDRWNYYAYTDGTITTVYTDPADGRSKSAIDGITVYSGSHSCAQLLLQTAQIFIADTFDAYALESLDAQGIHSVYVQDKGVIYTEEDAALTLHDPDYKTYFHGVK